MGQIVGDAKVRLEFDTSQAKEELDRIHQSLDKMSVAAPHSRAATTERARSKLSGVGAPGSPASSRYDESFSHLGNIIRNRAMSTPGAAMMSDIQWRATQAAMFGRTALQAITHPIQTARGAVSALGTAAATSPAVAAGLVYGIPRVGAQIGTLGMEAMEGLVPGLQGTGAFQTLKTEVDNLYKAFVNLEARVASMFSATADAAKLMGVVAIATKGGATADFGDAFTRYQNINRTMWDFDTAFDRFKSRWVAKGFGAHARRSMSDSMEAIFGGRMGD